MYRKEGKRYIVNLLVSELLDELSVAKACGEFKKAVKKYQQVNLLILDERLIRIFPQTKPTTFLELLRQSAPSALQSFVRGLKPMVGTGGLLNECRGSAPNPGV